MGLYVPYGLQGLTMICRGSEKEEKPETDPDWLLRKAERRAKIEAKRARLRDAPTQDYGDESSDDLSDDDFDY